MVSAFIIVSALIAIIAIALGAAYTTGALDPVIEKVAVLLFKAKAEAEAKKLQAQGLKEGEDFVKGKLNCYFRSHNMGRIWTGLCLDGPVQVTHLIFWRFGRGQRMAFLP